MVQGKLPVTGCSIILDKSRARAYCACNGGGGVVWTFFVSSIIVLFFLRLSGTQNEMLSQMAVKPKTPVQLMT